MMLLRFPTSPPKTLLELFERLRELVRQVERKILVNVIVETSETEIAHGLGVVPRIILPGAPHCIALIKQTRDADKTCIYLKASIRCVVNIEVAA